MSVNWPVHQLSDFITIKYGFAFKGEYFVDKKTSDCLVTPGNFALGCGFIRKMIRLHSEATELSKVLDTLLPKLLSGKLTLPEAEAEAEEVIAHSGEDS